MKKYSEWQGSGKDFDDFMPEPGEIDEDMYMYFLEVLPPNFHRGGTFQVGEPNYHDDNDVGYYSTFEERSTGFYYKGIQKDYNEKVPKKIKKNKNS